MTMSDLQVRHNLMNLFSAWPARNAARASAVLACSDTVLGTVCSGTTTRSRHRSASRLCMSWRASKSESDCQTEVTGITVARCAQRAELMQEQFCQEHCTYWLLPQLLDGTRLAVADWRAGPESRQPRACGARTRRSQPLLPSDCTPRDPPAYLHANGPVSHSAHAIDSMSHNPTHADGRSISAASIASRSTDRFASVAANALMVGPHGAERRRSGCLRLRRRQACSTGRPLLLQRRVVPFRLRQGTVYYDGRPCQLLKS